MFGGFCVFVRRGGPEWSLETSGTDAQGPVVVDRVGIPFVVESYVARLRSPGSFLRIGDALRRFSVPLLQRSRFLRWPTHGAGRAFLAQPNLPEY